MVPAFQLSANDFESIWKLGPTCITFGDAANVPTSAWLLELFDHTDVPGAGGYHLDENGRVSGKVFVGDAIKASAPWTIDATHEMLEMIGDPYTNKLVPLPRQRLQWFREVCDPVEADEFAYQIDGVWVSDFVTPSYGFTQRSGKFDFTNSLHAGCPALLPGGYVTLYDPIRRRYIQHFAQRADGTMSRRGRQSHRARRFIWGS